MAERSVSADVEDDEGEAAARRKGDEEAVNVDVDGEAAVVAAETVDCV